MKTVYYYQTFVGLTDILAKPSDVDVIIVSSIHFGIDDKTQQPYIHLNNHSPNHPKFDKLWAELKRADSLGIHVMVMVGGAGSAFVQMFANYDVYLQLLMTMLIDRPFLRGVDLDVEEVVELKNIKQLLLDLWNGFGRSRQNFTMTMAPVASSLITDGPGMGGFVYKDLFASGYGRLIDWFNVQAYGQYTADTLQAIVDNGYPAHRLAMGMLGSEFDASSFRKEALPEVCKMREQHPTLGGVDVWELFIAPPGPTPIEWASSMRKTNEKKETTAESGWLWMMLNWPWASKL